MMMEAIRPERGDIIPKAAFVLQLSSCFYAGIGIKFAVKDHYPDLRGKILTDWPDLSGIQLVSRLKGEDEVINLIFESVFLMTQALNRLLDLYSIDYQIIKENDRLYSQAEDIYWAIISDNFPQDGEVEDFDDEKYDNHLVSFSNSLVNVINCLHQLIADGEINTDGIYGLDNFCTKDPDYSDRNEEYLLLIVSDLRDELFADYMELLDLLDDIHRQRVSGFC